MAEPLAGAGVFGIGEVDDERLDHGALQRVADNGGEVSVGDQRLGLPMIEHEGDRGRVEARVQRVKHGAGHRDAKMASSMAGMLASMTATVSPRMKPRLASAEDELLRSRVELAIVPAQGPMRDRQPVRKHVRRALEEGERRQRLKIGGIAIEVAVVGREGT